MVCALCSLGRSSGPFMSVLGLTYEEKSGNRGELRYDFIIFQLPLNMSMDIYSI